MLISADHQSISSQSLKNEGKTEKNSNHLKCHDGVFNINIATSSNVVSHGKFHGSVFTEIRCGA